MIVGRGDRAHVDALVKAALPEHRAEVIGYFKPFAEDRRPANSGRYVADKNLHATRCLTVLWWKPVATVLA